ncbi:MAG: Fis family transcriptional regulator [Gammaproteobacteria bacterium]|nr:Fis family transcriptional regulator [Gammaproteobacteria bacterium]
MIEQTAVVIRIRGQYALVEAQRQSSCGSCNAKQGCGTGMLEGSIGRRAMQMQAINQCDARPGDEVVVAVPEKGFIRSAFFTYLLPLLLMLAGAIVAQQWSTHSGWAYQDMAALIGAAIGFVLAMLILRRYSRNMEKDTELHPVIIRKLNAPITVSLKQFNKEQQPF